jgi:serine/threonine protein kinase
MKLCISLFPLLYFFFLFLFFTSIYAAPDYNKCQNSYTCSGITTGYPFWGGHRPEICGPPGFNLSCIEDEESSGGKYTAIDIDGMRFRVIEIGQSDNILTIARSDLWEIPCSNDGLKNDTTLAYPLVGYIENENENLTLFYGCSDFEKVEADLAPKFNCSKNGEIVSIYYLKDSLIEKVQENPWFNGCYKESIKVRILKLNLEKLENEGSLNPQKYINGGFEVEYLADMAEMCSNCEAGGQLCAYDGRFVCVNKTSGNGGMSTKEKLAIGVGVGAGICCALFTFLGFCFYQRRKNKTKTRSLLLSRNITSEPSSMMDREKGDVSFGFGVQVFTYEELQEATNNFASDGELGDGGFGTVYYGNLQDGRSVAVKRLYENNYKRVEQFMNEVKLLARLRHRNLVQLYGCTSRHSRELLLVYEYISNGTLADHLHGEYAKARALPWNIRLNTAIETASALTYLHNTDIIHRDVKTNNILLDKNFTVKVADFGLSRLFPINATHVSTAPQGTPGYVDPEYHQCYQLTDKSDVFSFGVVLIELISSMTAVDITRHRHEINLSTMAINKIQNQALHELVDVSLGFDSDCEIRRMITDVAECAFQCLQYEKDMRPSMEEVFEALQRIKNPDYSKSRSRDLDFPGKDDAALLKKVPLSPVSVTEKWGSTSSRNTTPNTSS